MSRESVPVIPFCRPPVYTTSYEFAKMVGLRALKLSAGEKPLIVVEGAFNPVRIAKEEVLAKLVPFVVIRKLPDGTIEKFNLSDMIIREC